MASVDEWSAVEAENVKLDELSLSNSAGLYWNKIMAALRRKLDDVDSALATIQGGYAYKGTVSTFDDLPAEGNEIGDVYSVVEFGGENFAWTENGWTSLGSYTADVVHKSGTETIDGTKTFAEAIVGDVTGNAGTATEFASVQAVTLTGDVSGTASSTAGWTVATTLAASGVTAGTYGPDADASPEALGSFVVPCFSVDAKGRVTAVVQRTITLPADTDTTYTAFEGATSLADGKEGLVPKPLHSDVDKVLGAGGWRYLVAADITGGTISLDRIPVLDAARVPALDASKITTGTIDIARLPAAAVERIVVVQDRTARLALTALDVQLGDVVKQADTGLLYFVVDVESLDQDEGYVEFRAGSLHDPWLNVRDFGAVGDGTTPDTDAFRNALAAVSDGRNTIFVPDGTYLITGQLTLPANKRVNILGNRQTSIIKYTNFGCDKGVFYDDADGNSFTISGLYFTAASSTDEQRASDPIPIYSTARESQTYLNNLTFSGGGNTQIFSNHAFNCDWENIDISFTGYQPIWKSVDKAVHIESTSASRLSINVSENIFSAADEGQQVILGLPGSDSLAGFNARIQAFYDEDTVGLDRIYPIDISTSGGSTTPDTPARISFGPVTCSATAGSNVVTLSKECLSSSDIGRWVYLEGAGSTDFLIAKIAGISGAAVTLDKNAAQSVAASPLILTPAVFIGGMTSQNADRTNDLSITEMRIEGFRGVGVMIANSQNVRFMGLKTHGRSWGSGSGNYDDYGQTQRCFVSTNSPRVTIFGWEHDFCAGPVGKGSIKVSGSHTTIAIYSLWLSAFCAGHCFGEVSMTEPERGSVFVSDVQTTSRSTFSYLTSFIDFNSAETKAAAAYYLAGLSQYSCFDLS